MRKWGKPCGCVGKWLEHCPLHCNVEVPTSTDSLFPTYNDRLFASLFARFERCRWESPLMNVEIFPDEMEKGVGDGEQSGGHFHPHPRRHIIFTRNPEKRGGARGP